MRVAWQNSQALTLDANSRRIYPSAVAAATPAWYDVKSYGAVGNGSTDDRASIQSAINAAEAAGGGVVYFPQGTYLVGGTLVNDAAGVTLMGDGPKATTIRTNQSGGNVIALGNSSAAYSPAGGVRALSITSSVTRTTGHAISINGAEQGILENLRIATTGGSGIRFAEVASLAALWFVHHVDIEISGPFVGIWISDSNDRYFSDLWIRGNRAAASNGIYISKSGGDWFTNVEVVEFNEGITIAPGSGQSVAWLTFMNVLADTNVGYGWNFGGAGTTAGISCVSCWSATNGATSTSGRGFYLANANGVVLTAPRVVNNGGHGIEITSGAGNVETAGGIITGNSNASSGAANGIAVGSGVTGGVRIHDVRAGQSAGASNTQGYGISVATGADNYILTGNDTRNNIAGGINNQPGTSATRLVANNL